MVPRQTSVSVRSEWAILRWAKEWGAFEGITELVGGASMRRCRVGEGEEEAGGVRHGNREGGAKAGREDIIGGVGRCSEDYKDNADDG